jgi:Ricin-type beta-trefoil lectin domain
MKHILRAATAALMLAAGLGYLGARPAAADTVTGTKAMSTYTGTIRLVRMKPLLCLDDYDRQGTNGTKVQVWTCNGDPAQQWMVMSDGTIRPAIHPTLCLDADGTAQGAKVRLWACTTGKPNQQWNTNILKDQVTFDPMHTKHLVLTDPVDPNKPAVNGTQQELWVNHSEKNQYWETH